MKTESKYIHCIPLSELQGCQDCGMATAKSTHGTCGLCASIATFPIMEMLERDRTAVRVAELNSMIDAVLVH